MASKATAAGRHAGRQAGRQATPNPAQALKYHFLDYVSSRLSRLVDFGVCRMGLFIKANLATIGYRVRTYGKQKGKFISDRRRKQTTLSGCFHTF
jgi:hypothetical protein